MEIGLWSLAPLGPATFRIGVMHATTDQLRRWRTDWAAARTQEHPALRTTLESYLPVVVGLRCLVNVCSTDKSGWSTGLNCPSWSHSEDEAARRALGVIEVMRRGVWLSEWLAPRVRRKTVARVKRALLCHGVVVCGRASGSSVNKCTFLYIAYLALHDIRNCKRYPRLSSWQRRTTSLTARRR